MSNETDALDVASLVARNLSFYDKIKSKKAAESPCYTVIATLNDSKTQKLLTLATGTQANLKVKDNDIEDCHAESLLKRAYKRHLLDQLLTVVLLSRKGAATRETIRTRLSQKIQELNGRELVLFVSQFPCGFIRRFAGEEPVDEETGEVIMRKPGRGELRDGKLVYVRREDCFTKLKRWMSTGNGFEGHALGGALGITSRLVRIVIGDCEPDPCLDYQAYLDNMHEVFAPLTRTRDAHVELHRMRRADFVCEKGEKQPLPVSTIWWDSTPELCKRASVEYLVGGRRLGLTKKQSCESSRLEYMLQTSDYRLRADLASITAAML